MKIFNITVQGRVASYVQREGVLICDNGDYKVKFTFDAEWSDRADKTARFIWDDSYVDVPITADECTVPVIRGADIVYVGVYSGELITTTPATIRCRGSIKGKSSTAHDSQVEVFRDRAEEAALRAEAAADKVSEDAEKVAAEAAAKAAEQAVKAAEDAAVRAEAAAETAAAEAAAEAEEEVARLIGELGVVQNLGDSVTATMSQKATSDEISALKHDIAETGATCVLASGTVEATTPAYFKTRVLSGLSLKKDARYRLNIVVDTEATIKKTVWTEVRDKDDKTIKSLTIYTATLNTGALEFTVDKDYEGAFVMFQTEVTSGYYITATLEVFGESTVGKYCTNTDFLPGDFQHGDPLFWSNAVPDLGVKNRVMCKLTKIYKFEQDVHIKAAAGFRFAIGYYTDGVFTEDRKWATEATVPAGQEFRLQIARVIDDATETADIAEYVSKVRIFTGALKDLHDSVVETQSRQTVKPFEVLSINHRGYNTEAPENTLAAYKLSKKKGFDFVECDVRFTADGVPVLIHDDSINRTARRADGSELSSTIYIHSITYNEALTYDFGIWKGEAFAGTKITTLAEFMTLCRALSLHPYLDLYDCNSAARARTICNIIASCGMERNVTFLSSTYSFLTYVANLMPAARYGMVSYSATPTVSQNPAGSIDTLKASGAKNIFIDVEASIMATPSSAQAYITTCKENGLGLEVYCPYTEAAILNLDPFITGVTDDVHNAKKVLYNHFID